MQMFMLSANSSCTSFPICIPFYFGCTALARTFSAYVLSCFSCVWLFLTPWTVACQAPLSMGILQARILEWVAISFSRVSSQPRDWTQVSQILYHLSHQGSLFLEFFKFFRIFWSLGQWTAFFDPPVGPCHLSVSTVQMSITLVILMGTLHCLTQCQT